MKKSEVAKIAWKHSRKYNLDFSLIMAVIKAESNFDEKAVSPANCKGLMQLGPGVCKDYSVKNIFDPEENIRVGCEYLSWLEDTFSRTDFLVVPLCVYKVKSLFSRICFTLAAYNWGIGNIAKLQASQKKAGYDPGCFICCSRRLPKETKNYVIKILMEVVHNVVGAM
jgi:soluble lytic murein transglycosylase-like protein